MGVSPATIQGIAAGTRHGGQAQAASTENLAPRITRMARDAGCSHGACAPFSMEALQTRDYGQGPHAQYFIFAKSFESAGGHRGNGDCVAQSVQYLN